MTSQAHQLASAFWPGDLAMILRWRDLGLGQQHESVGVPNALVTMDPGRSESLPAKLVRSGVVHKRAISAAIAAAAAPQPV